MCTYRSQKNFLCSILVSCDLTRRDRFFIHTKCPTPSSRGSCMYSTLMCFSFLCCSYHSRNSVYRYISMFFVIMLLLARLSFANSPLNAVFTFTLPCLSTASHTRSSTFFRVFQKPSRLNVIHFNHNTRQYMVFKRDVDLSRIQTRDLLSRLAYPSPTCTKRRSNCVFASASRAILATTDCMCPTARRGHFGTIKFFKPLDALVASLQPREIFHQSSDLAALLQ